MFYNKPKSRASRAREMRENLSIIMASQMSKSVSSPSTAARPSTQAIGNIGPSPPTTAFAKVSISDVPKPVTAAQTRSALNLRSNGWLSTACSSRTICRTQIRTSSFLRTPAQSQPVFKVPFPSSIFATTPNLQATGSSSNGILLPESTPSPNMSFLFKHVQGPLPFESQNISNSTHIAVPSTPESSNNNSRIILQSPWFQRGQSDSSLVSLTKQYSVKELIDILCGDAEDIPGELDSIRQRVTSTGGTKRSQFEDTFFSTNDSILDKTIKRRRKSVSFEDEPFILDSLKEVQGQISSIFQ